MANRKTCKNCKHWIRQTIYKSDSETLCKAIPSRLGACSLFESDVNYWDGAEDAEPKIKTGFIGGENLYFDENFGCIHFEKY